MLDRTQIVCQAWLDQLGDVTRVNIHDADKACQCICNAARCILKAYIKEKKVAPEDTVLLTPLVEQCLNLHVVLPRSMRGAAEVMDVWENKHKRSDQMFVPRKQLVQVHTALLNLLAMYKEHISRNMQMFSIAEEERIVD